MSHDLFWQPQRGDLVALKPGTSAWAGALKSEREFPLRVMNEPAEIQGHLVMFCCPIGPLVQRVRANGRIVTERPSTQSVFVADELMPCDSPAAPKD